MRSLEECSSPTRARAKLRNHSRRPVTPQWENIRDVEDSPRCTLFRNVIKRGNDEAMLNGDSSSTSRVKVKLKEDKFLPGKILSSITLFFSLSLFFFNRVTISQAFQQPRGIAPPPTSPSVLHFTCPEWQKLKFKKMEIFLVSFLFFDRSIETLLQLIRSLSLAFI